MRPEPTLSLDWFDRLLGRQLHEVDCTVRVENTFDFLHSEVDLDGVAPNSGDAVQVLDAPTDVPYGEVVSQRCRARIKRGGPWDSVWARVSATADFPELFDLSFSERRKL